MATAHPTGPQLPRLQTFEFAPLNLKISGVHPDAVSILNRNYNSDLSEESFGKLFNTKFRDTQGDYFQTAQYMGTALSSTGALGSCSIAQICAFFPQFITRDSDTRTEALQVAALLQICDVMSSDFKASAANVEWQLDFTTLAIATAMAAATGGDDRSRRLHDKLVGYWLGRGEDRRDFFRGPLAELLNDKLSSFVEFDARLGEPCSTLRDRWRDLSLTAIQRATDIARLVSSVAPGVDPAEPFRDLFKNPDSAPNNSIEGSLRASSQVYKIVSELSAHPEWEDPFTSFGNEFAQLSVVIDLLWCETLRDWWMGYGDIDERNQKLITEILSKCAGGQPVTYHFGIGGLNCSDLLEEICSPSLHHTPESMVSAMNDYLLSNGKTSLSTAFGSFRPLRGEKFGKLELWLKSILEIHKAVNEESEEHVTSRIDLIADEAFDDWAPHPSIKGKAVYIFGDIFTISRSATGIALLKLFDAHDHSESSDFDVQDSLALAVHTLASSKQLPSALLGFDRKVLRNKLADALGRPAVKDSEVVLPIRKDIPGVVFYVYRTDSDGEDGKRIQSNSAPSVKTPTGVAS